MSEPVVGVVLAAGSSTRMGQAKQLLPFGGSTILQTVIESAEASLLETVVVVVAPGFDTVSLSVSRAEWAVNPQPGEGNLSSLLVASDSWPGQAVMVLLGDMPGVGTEIIDAVLGAWDADPGYAAIASYTDGEGHPFLLSDPFISSLPRHDGEKALWPLLQDEAQGEVRHIDIPFAKPIDINTEEDYRRALQRDA